MLSKASWNNWSIAGPEKTSLTIIEIARLIIPNTPPIIPRIKAAVAIFDWDALPPLFFDLLACHKTQNEGSYTEN